MGFFQILFFITLGIILSLWYATYRILKTVQENRRTLMYLTRELRDVKTQLSEKEQPSRTRDRRRRPHHTGEGTAPENKRTSPPEPRVSP